MPLPTPRSVISSPSHMTMPVPAVMVITMVVRVSRMRDAGVLRDDLVVRRSCGHVLANSWPERASATNAADCRTARPSVRYRVYWVIFAWPDWPSLRSCSRRGITTVSSCRMIDAVMYGMMPSAKTDSGSSAPPENRFSR